MFKPLSELFEGKGKGVQQGDVRAFIHNWLQQRLATDKVYCVEVVGRHAVIRVGTPVLFQEVYLAKRELQQILEKEADFTLKDIRIVSAYY